MSVIPEFIIQTTIVRGIRTLRQDSRYIDQLFRNLSQKDQQQIRKFLTESAIDLAINYPRDTLKVPAIVILLRREQEFAQGAYLGDSMGIGHPEEFSYDGSIDDSMLLGTGSLSSMGGLGPFVLEPTQATGGTVNTIDKTGAGWVNSAFLADQGQTVRIVAGTGQGQIRELVDNTMTSVVVSPNWTIVPDATSIFEIRGIESEIVGEPSKLYNAQDPTEWIERKGSLYALNYQVQVIGQNPEQTIYLYTVLKSILTLSRLFMEGQGLINLKMGGADFQPRTDYVPDFAYMRTLSLDFQYHFDTYQLLEDLATEFQVTLEGMDDTAEAVDLSVTTVPNVGRTAPTVS